MREIRYIEAINETLRQEMRRDPRVFVLGEDVRQGAFGQTSGLLQEFGEKRVLNTPISENGFCGAAIGAAMNGLRPVVELMLSTFAYVAMEQILVEAARLRLTFGGQVQIPVTFRMLSGTAGHLASQHSDQPYPMFANNPGIKVVLPSTPHDVKGLLAQAIRDPDPVVVFESFNLMGKRGPVPEEDYTIPFGQAMVCQEGKDVTVIGFLHMVNAALEAAQVLEREGVSVEVVDPRTLVPLDRKTILDSVCKTGRLVVADDSHRTCGAAAEIAACVADEGFRHLKAPIKRVTRLDVPIPYSEPLEKYVMPNKDRICQAIRETLR